MPNRNYERGRRREWAIVKELKAKGWDAARTAGSHGKFDIAAHKLNFYGEPIAYFIQVKDGCRASKDERDSIPISSNGILFELREYCNGRGQPPTITIAGQTMKS